MDLSKAHRFFDSRYHCARGFDFRAQLLAAPMEESSVYFMLPRRVLKLDAHSMVSAGDIVSSIPSGNMWLCGENGPSEFQGKTIYKTLKLFEVTHRNAVWKGFSTYEDEITEQKRKSVVQRGVIPVAIEFQKLQEDEMRISADMVRIITTSDVKVGDIIETYAITNVERQIGLNFCTAKRQ